MEIRYWKDADGNVGDDLNPWLWNRVFPNQFDFDSDAIFLGIGTLLNSRLVPGRLKTVVFGTGVGYGNPPAIDSSWDIFFVRGPISSYLMPIKGIRSITDPAILLHDFCDISQPRDRIGFIPHHVSMDHFPWEEICNQTGLTLVSPQLSVEKFSESLLQCKYVLTEAMHGAIIADSLRVPWVPIFMYPHIHHLKWADWCASMDLTFTPKYLKGPIDRNPYLSKKWAVYTLRQLALAARMCSPEWRAVLPHSSPRDIEAFCVSLRDTIENPQMCLSDDTVFQERISQIKEQCELFARRYEFKPPRFDR